MILYRYRKLSSEYKLLIKSAAVEPLQDRFRLFETLSLVNTVG